MMKRSESKRVEERKYVPWQGQGGGRWREGRPLCVMICVKGGEEWGCVVEKKKRKKKKSWKNVSPYKLFM